MQKIQPKKNKKVQTNELNKLSTEKKRPVGRPRKIQIPPGENTQILTNKTPDKHQEQQEHKQPITNTLGKLINNNSSFCALLVGTNQTGKTSFLNSYIANIDNKHFVYITPYIEINKPVKENNILFINPNDFFNLDFNLLSDSMIIFDDCRKYISTNLIEKNTRILNDLIIQRRYLKIEFFFVFHSFAQIPTFLFDYFNYFVIKKTNDNIQKLKNRLLNFEEIETTQSEVNKHSNNYYYKVLNFTN